MTVVARNHARWIAIDCQFARLRITGKTDVSPPIGAGEGGQEIKRIAAAAFERSDSRAPCSGKYIADDDDVTMAQELDFQVRTMHQPPAKGMSGRPVLIRRGGEVREDRERRVHGDARMARKPVTTSSP